MSYRNSHRPEWQIMVFIDHQQDCDICIKSYSHDVAVDGGGMVSIYAVDGAIYHYPIGRIRKVVVSPIREDK